MDGRRKNRNRIGNRIGNRIRNRIENCAREEPGNDRIEKDASVCRALFYRRGNVVQVADMWISLVYSEFRKGEGDKKICMIMMW